MNTQEQIDYIAERLGGEFELRYDEEDSWYRGFFLQGDVTLSLTATYSIKNLALDASLAYLEGMYVKNLSEFLNGEDLEVPRFSFYQEVGDPPDFAVLDLQTRVFWTAPTKYEAWEKAVVARHRDAHPALIAALHRKLRALAGERGYTLVETFDIREKKIFWGVRVRSPLFDFEAGPVESAEYAYKQALGVVDARLQCAIEDIRAALGEWGML